MSNNDDAVGILRTIRDAQPAHYLLKIQSFSILSEGGVEKYESDNFEVGGYKWGLCFYPNGNKKQNVDDHISLYLVIRDTDKLPPGWEANVQFKFFVFDHIRDKYLTLQDADGRTRHYHQMKTELGFSKLLSLDEFQESSNGYLIDDSCLFGVEVFVIKYAGKGECLSMPMSMIKELMDNTHTLKVDNFSAISQESPYSETFESDGYYWELCLFPKGYGKAEGGSLFVFLAANDSENSSWKFYAKLKLRVRDQVQDKHKEKEVSNWFCDSETTCGFNSFMPLSELNDESTTTN